MRIKISFLEGESPTLISNDDKVKSLCNFCIKINAFFLRTTLSVQSLVEMVGFFLWQNEEVLYTTRKIDIPKKIWEKNSGSCKALFLYRQTQWSPFHQIIVIPLWYYISFEAKFNQHNRKENIYCTFVRGRICKIVWTI